MYSKGHRHLANDRYIRRICLVRLRTCNPILILRKLELSVWRVKLNILKFDKWVIALVTLLSIENSSVADMFNDLKYTFKSSRSSLLGSARSSLVKYRNVLCIVE